jgi:hypothetical protein
MGYILATDADVRFGPADVKALHTLLSRCGQTLFLNFSVCVSLHTFSPFLSPFSQRQARGRGVRAHIPDRQRSACMVPDV